MNKLKNNLHLQDLGSVLFNMALALVIGSFFLLLQGENPFEVFYYLLLEPFTMSSGWIKVLSKATPYLFTGLAAALAFRCGIFNIGIEGQMFLGALAATVVGLSFQGLPFFIHVPLALAAAMAVGGLWALLAGWLKVRFGVHEVLSTIMLNYLATNLGTYLIINWFRSDGPAAKTPNVQDSARLRQFFPAEQLNTGIFVALITVVAVYVLVKYLPLGWKIDSAGKNMLASRYAGIDSKKIIMAVMMLSGMVAALCGAERTLGAYGYMDIGFSANYGSDGLVIAIIAGNNPLAVVLVALFFGLLNYGGVNLNMMTSVPSEWVQSLIAIMLILVAAKNGIFTNLIKAAKQVGKRRSV